MSENPLTVFGIPHCDTVKKVISKLKEKNIPFEFINFKVNSSLEDQLILWEKAFGEAMVNRKGPTFRNIQKAYDSATTPQKRKLLQDHSSAIKRPIIQSHNTVLCHGYDEQVLEKL